MAIAIISGLIVEFTLVLLAIPVLIGLTLPRGNAAANEGSEEDVHA